MNSAEIDKLKRLAIGALFSDDQLMNVLVLKGGNALSLVHNMTSRASFDLDFSMEGDFSASELGSIAGRIEARLRQAFVPAEYHVFDVKLEPKPESLSDDLKDFWGGYAAEFKILPLSQWRELDGDLYEARRRAVPPKPGGRARFEIDISKYEYCVGKQTCEIDRLTVFVYTPTMVACEKLRAICQQRPAYAESVKKKHRAVRARDFFDIHQVLTRYKVDLSTPDTLDLIRNMFEAKRVPLGYLAQVGDDREFHRDGWRGLKDTVDQGIQLREFDFYFDFVRRICADLATALVD